MAFRLLCSGLVSMAAALACVGCGPARVAGPVADAAAAAVLRESLRSGAADGEEAAEGIATGTGWASLKGQFVFAGSPGDKRPLVVDKDTAVCSKDGMKLYD